MGVALGLGSGRVGAQAPPWRELSRTPRTHLQWRPDSAEAGYPVFWVRHWQRTVTRAVSLEWDTDAQRFAADCSRRRVQWLATEFYLRGELVGRDHLEPQMGEDWELPGRARPGVAAALSAVCTAASRRTRPRTP